MKEMLQWIVYGGCVAVLFLPLIVADSMFFPFITGKNFWFRIIVEVVLAAWILLALYDPKYRPRFSWLLPTTGALLLVMFFANLLGEFPLKSFWSNYERMDGYVTLVHFVGYFVVLGSVFTHQAITFAGRQTTAWFVFLLFALASALMVSFTAFQQLAGITETTMSWRINGTLGNAAYMAIYMLFNVFIAAWVGIHAKQTWLRVVCVGLVGLFIFLLMQTATRGTIVGLAGGIFVSALYIALFNTQYPVVRKWALGLVVALILVVGGLAVGKETAFVQESSILNRATNISLQALDLRITIWQLAVDGIAERPLLGWGQGNFNYIFNLNYDPSLGGRAEEWYDRGHNVFIDWLSTGGVLGLAAYLSMFAALVYYLVWSPARERFTVTERGLLIGIVTGYFIHNLVVFDNIVSYIFFAVLLALIHSRVSAETPLWADRTFNPAIVSQVVTPTVLVVATVVIYLVNVPSMQAASDLIDAFRSPDPMTRLAEFQSALDRDGFARQEITEQLAQQALQINRNPEIPAEVRGRFISEAEAEIQNLITLKPGDARVHVFAMGFYRGLNQLPQAREQAVLALQYSPDKPSIVLEQGLIEFQANDIEAMNGFFKAAYDLNPVNRTAQVSYAAGLILAGADRSAIEPVLSEAAWGEFATDRLAIIAAERSENFELLADMFAYQVETAPNNAQSWVSLAFTQHRLGQASTAIETLESATTLLPNIETATQCFIANIEAGREPGEGC